MNQDLIHRFALACPQQGGALGEIVFPRPAGVFIMRA
jgi:hypothetical protein